MAGIGPNNEDEYEQLVNDMFEGKKHGLGIGYNKSGRKVAEEYFVKGVGKYKPNGIHKMLVPEIQEIEVKVSWRHDGGWRRYFSEMDSDTYERLCMAWRDEKYPERAGDDLEPDDYDKWENDVEPNSDEAEYIDPHIMVDVIFYGKPAKDGEPPPIETFGFKCVCTDHGGSIF